jgi:hypothetical protein
MAIYKYGSNLMQLGNAIFDEEHEPGQPAPRAGIYQCLGCGREVIAAEDAPLPSADHHTHLPADGILRWKLLVFADHRPTRRADPPEE